MKIRNFLLSVILASVLQAQGQLISTNTQGNNTGNNQTLVDPQVSLQWQYNYVQALDASLTPSGIADNLKDYFNAFTALTKSLNNLAESMSNKSLASSMWNFANISATWYELLDDEGDVYGPVANLFATIEFAKDNVECYNIFNYPDLLAYVGITSLTDYFFNNDTSKDSAYEQKLDMFCSKENDIMDKKMNELLDTLLGKDSSCDLLQDVYDGLLPVQIFRGYRDLLANAFGYIMLDVQWVQMVQSGCLAYNGATHTAESVSSQYDSKVQQVIDRYYELDQNITSNPNATILGNLQSAIDMFANASDPLSAFVGAINVDYYLPYIYPYLDWFIFVYSSNATSDDVFVTCNQCILLNDQNGLSYVVYWTNSNYTSSLSNSTMNQTGSETATNATSSGPQAIAEQISLAYTCISGVIAINKDVDQYVIQYLGDKYQTQNVSNSNVYLWGVQEDCQENFNNTNSAL